MKKLLILIAFLFSSIAASAVFQPTTVKFKKSLDDDVSMTYSQRVFVYVKNTSGVEQRVEGPIAVVLNGKLKSGLLYGPDNIGGLLYGPVPVRKIGKIIVRLPVGTLKHCQRVKFQSWVTSGEKTMTAYEMGNNRPCLRIPPIRRLPRPLIRR